MKPYWSTIALRCMKCRTEWDDWQPNDCPIDTWIAHVGTYRCPKCRAKANKIALRCEQKGELIVEPMP